MSWISSFFGNKKTNGSLSMGVRTELHSHLLPMLDDGVQSFEESVDIIRRFSSLGVRKLITTPHVMGDFYKNTPEGINEKLVQLQQKLKEAAIPVEVQAAAEYYLDESFLTALEQEKPLLTFGDKYILFETSYINASAFFSTAVFAMKSQGYKPILAHPERYTYLYGSFDKVREMYDKGVYFQLNINSLSGYYSKDAKKIAERLIDEKMVDFIGSDCHGMRHMHALSKSIATKYYSKLMKLKLLNDSL